MYSKQIAVNYLAPKINNPVTIFKDTNILKLILPWAKDSAKELFATQESKIFLTSYVDDLAPIIDEYLIKRSNKMYKKALLSENKLFSNLCSSQKTVGWIIDRWINTFVNLTSNPKYKDYIDIAKINRIIKDELHTTYCDFEEILEFEELEKLDRETLKNGLQIIWEKSKFDLDFERSDMEYLCEKFGFEVSEIIETEAINLQQYKKEQAESGNSQLVFVFDSQIA